MSGPVSGRVQSPPARWHLSQSVSMFTLVLLHWMSLVTVEARGKGGAANGGGNSWRGGNQLSLSSCWQSHSCSVPPQSRGWKTHRRLGDWRSSSVDLDHNSRDIYSGAGDTHLSLLQNIHFMQGQWGEGKNELFHFTHYYYHFVWKLMRIHCRRRNAR